MLQDSKFSSLFVHCSFEYCFKWVHVQGQQNWLVGCISCASNVCKFKSCLRCLIWEMSRKVLTMCCLLTLEKSPAALTVMITASLEYWQCKQIVLCETCLSVSLVRKDCLSSCMLEPWASPPQRHTSYSQTQEVYASVYTLVIFVNSLIVVVDFNKQMIHKRTHSYSLSSTLFFWACVLNNQNERSLFMVFAHTQEKRDPCQPDFRRIWSVLYFHSWTVCLSGRCDPFLSLLLIGLLWVTCCLHFTSFPVSIYSPSLPFACSNPHLLVLCLCLLPVLLRTLSLMYLRPPQAAVFTRPLQGGNRRRMTWSMFPAEESTAISLLQLSQPFFIMSWLCSSRYR